MLDPKIIPYGYTVTRVIQGAENDRFWAAAVTSASGASCFLKAVNPLHSNQDDLKIRLARQCYYYNSVAPVLGSIETLGKHFRLRSPRVLEMQDGWYICEFVSHSPIHLGSLAWEKTGEVLASLLASLNDNRFTELFPVEKSPTRFDNLDDAVDGWKLLSTAVDMGVLTSSMITDGRGVIRRHAGSLTSMIQHSDCAPAHILVGETLGSSEIVLIDPERSAPENPRLYDLACLYVRIISYTSNWDFARLVLRRFLEQQDLPVSYLMENGFLSLMTLRALGICCDSVADLYMLDYRKDARQLLDLCLSERVEALIG